MTMDAQRRAFVIGALRTALVVWREGDVMRAALSEAADELEAQPSEPSMVRAAACQSPSAHADGLLCGNPLPCQNPAHSAESGTPFDPRHPRHVDLVDGLSDVQSRESSMVQRIEALEDGLRSIRGMAVAARLVGMTGLDMSEGLERIADRAIAALDGPPAPEQETSAEVLTP